MLDESDVDVTAKYHLLFINSDTKNGENIRLFALLLKNL